MRVVLDVQTVGLTEPELAAVFQTYIQAAAKHNALLIQKAKGRLPTLYDSGVIFRNEPWMGLLEEVASIPLVMLRGWGDCDDLVAWRIGELLAEGKQAHPKIYWRDHPAISVNGEAPKHARLYHAEVRMPDGSVEDPSRYLGM